MLKPRSPFIPFLFPGSLLHSGSQFVSKGKSHQDRGVKGEGRNGGGGLINE